MYKSKVLGIQQWSSYLQSLLTELQINGKYRQAARQLQLQKHRSRGFCWTWKTPEGFLEDVTPKLRPRGRVSLSTDVSCLTIN